MLEPVHGTYERIVRSEPTIPHEIPAPPPFLYPCR